MGNYFVAKTQDIQTKLNDMVQRLPDFVADNASETITPLHNFTTLTEEVLKLVKGCKKKGCNLDPMPTPLFHNKVTALLKITNDILLKMNSQEVTLLVLLDLSAAFDTVNHNILIDRLNEKVGLQGKALDWFKSYLNNRSQQVSIAKNEATPPGYKLCGHPRPDRIGGGTAIVFRDTLCTTKLAADTTIFYKSPDGDILKFVDLLLSMGLQQHVEFSTHVSGNTLDLVITREVDSILGSPSRPDHLFSDYMAISFGLNSSKPLPSKKCVTYRSLKSINITSFMKDLGESKLCSDAPTQLDSLVSCYNNTLSSVLDRHAPLKRRIVTSRAMVPWYDEEIKLAKKERRKAEQKWRTTKKTADFNKFKSLKNHCTQLMRKAKCSFFSDFVKENSNNQGSLFKAIKGKLVEKNAISFPGHPPSDDNEDTNRFLGFVIQVAQGPLVIGRSWSETALLKVLNDILLSMNSQRVTLLVLLDLSSAFDTIDHGILLERLRSKFGIHGKVLSWFSSYLSGRSQRVMLNGFVCMCHSNLTTHAINVKRSRNLTHAITCSLRLRNFGMNFRKKFLLLSISFKPARTSKQDVVRAMENCVEKIRCWMIYDKLLMNDGKTEFMLIGTRQQLSKLQPINISMSKHITKTCKACFFHLHNIRRIKNKLDYSNSLLYGLPKKQISKLQRVQNATARMPDWLWIYGNILILRPYSQVHNQAPSYIKDLIEIKSKSSYCLRSNSAHTSRSPQNVLITFCGFLCRRCCSYAKRPKTNEPIIWQGSKEQRLKSIAKLNVSNLHSEVIHTNLEDHDKIGYALLNQNLVLVTINEIIVLLSTNQHPNTNKARIIVKVFANLNAHERLTME
ncbi:Hypothetical predicted protein, partial [Paramuricea clavata]